MAFQENANLALFQVFHGGKGRISGYCRTPVQHFQVVPFLRGLSQTTLTPKLFRMFSASSPKTILWPPTQICGNPTPPPPASAGHYYSLLLPRLLPRLPIRSNILTATIIRLPPRMVSPEQWLSAPSRMCWSSACTDEVHCRRLTIHLDLDFRWRVLSFSGQLRALSPSQGADTQFHESIGV